MCITVAAIYENGVLRLLTPLPLPENTRVQIHIERTLDKPVDLDGHALQRILALAIDLGIDDLAEQHDHYLYGVEKQ